MVLYNLLQSILVKINLNNNQLFGTSLYIIISVFFCVAHVAQLHFLKIFLFLTQNRNKYTKTYKRVNMKEFQVHTSKEMNR